jgi:hypothetical protein
MRDTELQKGIEARREILKYSVFSLLIVLAVTSCAGAWLTPHSNEQ